MTDFILNHRKYRASLIARLKYGMEWWNGKRNGTVLALLSEVEQPSVSLGLLSHRTSFTSLYSIANCHAFISKQGTVTSSSSGALLL